jgi:hypothetical protein
MEQENKKCWNWGKGSKGGSPAGAVYGLGFIGAAIYYIHMATTFTMGVVGILKALVWPAFLVYKIFEYFHF